MQIYREDQFFFTASSQLRYIASSFNLLSFSLCSSSNLSFSAPFSSLAFCVASWISSLFFLSSSNFSGSLSCLISSSSKCLNTSMILAFALFLIHFLTNSAVLFFSLVLTSSMTISLRSSLKISLTLQLPSAFSPSCCSPTTSISSSQSQTKICLPFLTLISHSPLMNFTLLWVNFNSGEISQSRESSFAYKIFLAGWEQFFIYQCQEFTFQIEPTACGFYITTYQLYSRLIANLNQGRVIDYSRTIEIQNEGEKLRRRRGKALQQRADHWSFLSLKNSILPILILLISNPQSPKGCISSSSQSYSSAQGCSSSQFSSMSFSNSTQRL